MGVAAEDATITATELSWEERAATRLDAAEDTITELRREIAILKDGRCVSCMEPVNPLHPKCACIRAEIEGYRQALEHWVCRSHRAGEQGEPTPLSADKRYPIEIIQGVEGFCIGVNNYRLVGPKPWGGGTVVKRWNVSLADLGRAIPELSATIDAQATEIAALKGALENLMDEQNGPPLIRDAASWQVAMDNARRVLAGKEAQG